MTVQSSAPAGHTGSGGRDTARVAHRPLTWTSTANAPADVLVSIIIDNCNYGHYLADAIDSALGQTWGHVEVVVVDDGSTDNSREIIHRYRDRIVPVLKENGGQGSAFNAGWEACSGDVIVFLDADDVLHHDFAERAVTALFAGSGALKAAMAQFRLRVVNAELRPVGTVVPPAHVRLASGDVAEAVRNWVAGSSLAPGGAAAFPRVTLQALFPLPAASLPQGVDYYLVRGAALLGKVAAIDADIADYRAHSGNDSNRASLDLHGLREALRRQVGYGLLLHALSDHLGVPPPVNPLDAHDPLFLSQRLVSLRCDAHAHPFAGDTRARLLRQGLRAVAERRDVGTVAKMLHAGWFVVVAYGPERLTTYLATRLILPLARGRLGLVINVLIAGRSLATSPPAPQPEGEPPIGAQVRTR